MVGVTQVGSNVTIVAVVRAGQGPSRSRDPGRGNSKSDAGQLFSDNPETLRTKTQIWVGYKSGTVVRQQSPPDRPKTGDFVGGIEAGTRCQPPRTWTGTILEDFPEDSISAWGRR